MGSPLPSPPASHVGCVPKNIKSQLNNTAFRTKGFLKEYIENRLQNKSFGESEKECLMRCFQAYHASIASIDKANTDVSENKFSYAIIDVVAYLSFIGSTMKLKCSSNIIAQNPEFSAMQKWSETNAQDLLKQLKICAKLAIG
ncbi:hypothetical protein M9H77_13950 [Catharanthus roseus]|uniref:Uncharacterized protein n=1 Tax=Catharanthus roseus TaxID=4058 RepID=A0ACC0BLW6_CATRO|nr:hypothetical protein M9H77_13950 [Catharanthus roseus]